MTVCGAAGSSFRRPRVSGYYGISLWTWDYSPDYGLFLANSQNHYSSQNLVLLCSESCWLYYPLLWAPR